VKLILIVFEFVEIYFVSLKAFALDFFKSKIENLKKSVHLQKIVNFETLF